MALWPCRRGTAAVETALVLPFILLPLLFLMFGAGQALLVQSRLDRAMHAALLYAWGQPKATNAMLESAAAGGYGPSGPAMAPKVTGPVCFCVALATGARVNTPIPCGLDCLAGFVRGSYMTVTTSAEVSMMPAVTWQLSASGTVRVE